MNDKQKISELSYAIGLLSGIIFDFEIRGLLTPGQLIHLSEANNIIRPIIYERKEQK